MMWNAEDSSYTIDYDPNDRLRNFKERSAIVLEDKWGQGEDAIAIYAIFMTTHSILMNTRVNILLDSYRLS